MTRSQLTRGGRRLLDRLLQPSSAAGLAALLALLMPELAEHARRELRASGETSRSRTPDARDQLTPQELQIAQLAAEGLSNREIGQKLYISHRTVGYHLHRIFPKLGITSRTQLRPALLGPSLDVPE